MVKRYQPRGGLAAFGRCNILDILEADLVAIGLGGRAVEDGPSIADRRRQ